MKNERLTAWESRSEIPMTVLAVGFLVAYAWPILEPDMDSSARQALRVLSWTVWAVYLAEFIIRVSLADRRPRYVLRHWYDVVLVAAPMLRPLRLLRLIQLARVLHRSSMSTLAGSALIYAASSAIAAVFLGSLAVLSAERGEPGANIQSFGDALWWACVTVTTVGYGDFYPVTTQGRFVAVALMIVGIGLVGAVTASVATTLLAQVDQQRRSEAVPDSDR